MNYYLSLITLTCFAAILVNASGPLFMWHAIKPSTSKIQFHLNRESGYYVPKGYYVIHSDGQQSALSQIKPSHQLLLQRLRRSAQFSSSSSSSSSSASSNGGPVFFHQSTSSHVSPGGISSQSYYPGVVGSLDDRFNGDDYDDDDYDDVPLPFNNNRPTYSSPQIQSGTFIGNGNNRPSYSSQTQTGNFAGNGFQSNFNSKGVNSQSSGSLNRPFNGNTVTSQSSSVSRPTTHGVQTQSTGAMYPSSNGNVVFTQSNNNGVHSQTSGVIYPNGQVQITSHKTGKF